MASLAKAICPPENGENSALNFFANYSTLNRFINRACLMDQNDPHISLLDLNRLVKRLTACAARWFLQQGCSGTESVLPATGQSAKDLAFATLGKFIKGEINWQPRAAESVEQEVYALLKRVMRHDFLDLVKEGREYKRTEVRNAHREADDELPALEDLADDSLNLFHNLETEVVVRQVYPLLQDAPELREYVDALLYGNCSKREDIATYLGITPQEVTNRHKRLQARLEPWKIAMEKAGVSRRTNHD